MYEKVRSMIDDVIMDRFETRSAIKHPVPPDVDQLKFREVVSESADDASEKESETESARKLTESLNQAVVTVNATTRGEDECEGKRGQRLQQHHQEGQRNQDTLRQSTQQRQCHQPYESGESTGKGKGTRKVTGKSEGRAKGTGKRLTWVCGGVGHPARLCPSEGWVNTLCESFQTEDEDEAMQSGFLDTDTSPTSPPPGICDKLGRRA